MEADWAFPHHTACSQAIFPDYHFVLISKDGQLRSAHLP